MYTNTDKKKFLQALEASKGIVTEASRATGISREAHYAWMKNNPVYQAEVLAIKEVTIDFGEACLFKAMEKGDTSAIIYFMRCQARARGYREKDAADTEGQKVTLDITDRLKGLLEKV